MLYYVLAIFLSSFLLFQIQPLISKYILPWFGGTTNVWSASLLFFQLFLTGGYAYAYWLIRRVSPRRQGVVHIGVLGLSVLMLTFNMYNWGSPNLPGEEWRNLNLDQPLGEVLKILTVAVGLPYFLLSTNSTLMQAWFSQEHPDRSPYWLYALSNVGSFVGLLTYPILFEPRLSLKAQSIFWTAGYVVFVLVIGFQAFKVFRSANNPNQKPIERDDAKRSASLPIRQFFSWAGSAALASSLLLATTTSITQEVAAIPFLWVLPLTIYLLSFVLSFSGERWYNRTVFLGFLTLASLAYIIILVNPNMNYLLQLVVYLGLLFVSTMICHGELYRSRPKPARLTSFYLLTSIGGAIGGITINLVVPLIFNGYWEFQISLSLVWGVLFVLITRSLPKFRPLVARLLFALTALGTILFIGIFFVQTRSSHSDLLTSVRNFYGVLWVREQDANNPTEHRYVLNHGITMHGFQFTTPVRKSRPTAYYAEDAGIGLTFLNHPQRPANLKAGMVGLGVGVLAVYGEPGDDFRFYEINPAVAEIAEGQYFSFMRDSAADINIVLGDGRISLESELSQSGTQNFDLLVIDAFNSDSIPTHLLTKEAFELYLAHLKPDGILALHVSNRHLNLRNVVWKLADEFGLPGVEITNSPPEDDTRSYRATWILLTQNEEFLAVPEIATAGAPPPSDLPDLRLWTDDYSNLFQILY